MGVTVQAREMKKARGVFRAFVVHNRAGRSSQQKKAFRQHKIIYPYPVEVHFCFGIDSANRDEQTLCEGPAVRELPWKRAFELCGIHDPWVMDASPNRVSCFFFLGNPPGSAPTAI